MARFLIALFGSVGLIATAPASAGSSELPLSATRTDADLVTAIDVSGSIDGYAEWLSTTRCWLWQPRRSVPTAA